MNWDTYFLNLAKTISLKSPDVHTKHGCVLVNPQNHIVGTGFNGFPKILPNEVFPTTRPEKYDFIIHAELNAILNSTGTLVGCRCYVTGKPCLNCLSSLWQSDVKHIIYGSTSSLMCSSPEYEKKYQFLLDLMLDTGLRFEKLED